MTITLRKMPLHNLLNILEKNSFSLMVAVLFLFSIVSFVVFYLNDLGLAYNDSRSHLNISRRVVEGLKPGFAQIGSVWLPLPHLLMIPTIWNDFLWHTGLSGALQSMISYIVTGIVIFQFLKHLSIPLPGRLIGVAVFATNTNILYLQATAMTELLLIATMTIGVFELVRWERSNNIYTFIKAAFFIMLATLIRYDGWFLLAYSVLVIAIITFFRKGYKITEGNIVLFTTLAGFGIVLWVLWNLVIFHDPLYFAFGPYSAHAQQEQLEAAGNLATKGNLPFSIKTYFYALAYNSNIFILLLGLIGSIVMIFDKTIRITTKLVLSALYAPVLFNILALYLGHSVLFITGLSGNTWFNVRYGIMMMPSIAIFIGYLFSKLFPSYRILLIGLIFFVTAVSFMSKDAVTIDDGKYGSSQKNVTEVSTWLRENAAHRDGFVLVSAASHDAIIFSSGLPMKKIIHEGTGKYWEEAAENPHRWARWIVMRTYDMNDQTFRLVSESGDLRKYELIESYPFADIYELKPEFMPTLQTKAIY